VYQRGLIRLGTEQYASADRNNLFAHLTNYSINKENKAKTSKKTEDSSEDHKLKRKSKDTAAESINTTEKEGKEGHACKWTIQELMDHLAKNGVDTKKLWKKMEDLMLKTIAILVGKCGHCPQGFELVGFDIMLDQDMNVHLIEVNMEPSLNMDSPLDFKLKTGMLDDISGVLSLDELHKNGNKQATQLAPLAMRLMRRAKFLSKNGKEEEAKNLVKGYGGTFGVNPDKFGAFKQVYPMDLESMYKSLQTIVKVQDVSELFYEQHIRPIHDVIIARTSQSTESNSTSKKSIYLYNFDAKSSESSTAVTSTKSTSGFSSASKPSPLNPYKTSLDSRQRKNSKIERSRTKEVKSKCRLEKSKIAASGKKTSNESRRTKSKNRRSSIPVLVDKYAGSRQ